MSYVYHAVPDKLVGNLLVPLTTMHSLDPDLYKEYLQKYEGRREILERKIGLLDCLWNDVVQFLPLHPRKVFELQKSLGLITEIPAYKYFEIDVVLLDPAKTVVWFKDAPGEQNVKVEWLKNVKLDELQEVPPATVNYFKSLVGTGEGLFNYQFIPHIVYKGSVDISTAKIIEL